MSTMVDLNAAIEKAVCAPSIHNSQPWRWRTGPGEVDLYADLTRHLPWTDPDRRDLLLSCGAALHHLRVALAEQNLGVEIHRLEDPDNEWHLASVRVRSDGANLTDAALASAISKRRTDRRRMSRRPIPDPLIHDLADLVAAEDAVLSPVSDTTTRMRLDSIINDAARAQSAAPGYAAELQMWTHRLVQSGDGIARRQLPENRFSGSTVSPLRPFPEGDLPQPPIPVGAGDGADAAELFAVVTAADDYRAWLRAGEALSALLLGATVRGLATTPLSQAMEIAETRDRVRRDILGAQGNPQILVRIGWPASTATDLPPVARRDIRTVLTGTDAEARHTGSIAMVGSRPQSHHDEGDRHE